MPRAGLPPGTPYGPDWQLKALIARHQFGNGVSNDVTRMLADFYVSLQQRLESGVDLTNWQRDQLRTLTDWARQRLNEIIPLAQRATADGMASLAGAELIGQHGQTEQLRAVMGVASRAQLVQASQVVAIAARIDVGGVALGEWWQRDAVATLTRIKRTVQQELLLGKGPREIARLAISRDPGVLTLERANRASVRTMVRTALTAVSSAAQQVELQEMRDVVQRLRFEALIDSRTSVVCLALDNSEYDIDAKNLPWPPLHPNCRSALVPLPDLSSLGLTSSALGRVVTYDEWLQKQDVFTQRDILGNVRAAQYRAGTLTLQQMVTTDHRVIPVERLIERMKAA